MNKININFINSPNNLNGNNSSFDINHFKNMKMIDPPIDYLYYTTDLLIDLLVPNSFYIPKKSFVYTILLCSRMNIRPSLLFNKLSTLTIKSILNMTFDESIKTLNNYLYIINEWTNLFPYDFRNNEMMLQFDDIYHKLISYQSNFKSDLDFIYKKLKLKLKSLNNYEEYIKQLNQKTLFNLNQSNLITDIIDQCSSPIQFAQQLTHIELDRLRCVGDEELIQYFIMKLASEESNINLNENQINKQMNKIYDKKLTNSLEYYIQWFNKLTFFIPTEILKHTQKKLRIKVINYFIDAAFYCFQIKNFNSMFAIIGGLNMQPIRRLKKTWEKVDYEKFHKLEEYVNVSKNFSIYRLIFKISIEEAQKSNWICDKFVIPFTSIILQDVYFIKTHSQDYYHTGGINLKKYYSMAKFISQEFQPCKQSKCSFERDDQIINYIITSPTFNEDSLMLASFECETPINNYERDKYKLLEKSLKKS